MNQIDGIYVVCFRYASSDAYAIWYSTETDGFFIQDQSILRFDNLYDALNQLHILCEQYQISADMVEKATIEIAVYDVSAVLRQVFSSPMKLCCSDVLGFWNIVSDMASSISHKFLGDTRTAEITGLYEKLVCGCNLPALKVSTQIYSPKWSAKECKLLKAVIEDGVAIVLQELFYA